jgi:predicted regulator of Ras-like GTPase activity (Roadblock/LC7/MglB family)
MDAILQGLMELPGVRAALVLDGAGQVVAHRGSAVYDRAACEHVGGTIARAVESIQLQHEEWETLAAQYADGRLVLRRVPARPGGEKHVVVVVADASLNASFATVALRVAANKVRSALEGGGSQPGTAGSQPLPPSASPHAAAGDSRPVLASTGVSWAKSSSLGSSVGPGGSSATLSGVSAADPAAAALLSRCVKELARHVGPISKVYVQEGVRRVSPEAPFSTTLARALVDDLSGQIEDPKDRAAFRKALLESK